MSEQAQSGYYQAIAREFLRRRGGPFFLSPRDLAVIAEWEKDRVPLEVVLEGIGRAFDASRDPARGKKGVTLAYCRVQVRRALAQHADRGAGRTRKTAAPRSEKAARARAEAEACLRRLPAGEAELRRLLGAARDLLTEASPDEPALERVDEDVDEILWRRSSAAERETSRRQAAKERAGHGAGDLEDAVRTRLVKAAREKSRIPYISLFYY